MQGPIYMYAAYIYIGPCQSPARALSYEMLPKDGVPDSSTAERVCVMSCKNSKSGDLRFNREEAVPEDT